MLLLFFLIIDLYLLIPAVIAQIYVPIAEFAILPGVNEVNEKIKTQFVVAETKITKCLT